MSVSWLPIAVTIAGVAAPGLPLPAACELPDSCAANMAWTATSVEINAGCVTRGPGRALLLCGGTGLLRVEADGRLRPWWVASPGLVGAEDADAASDGTVMALIRGIPSRVVRIAPDGVTTDVATVQTQGQPRIAALHRRRLRGCNRSDTVGGTCVGEKRNSRFSTIRERARSGLPGGG